MSKESYIILVVDDETDVLEFVSYNLKREGYSVFQAVNGKNAIESALKIRPHLILLDVMMPGMDGIETCEKLREIPEMNNTIIAFLTARGEDYSQIAGFEAGGDDYIVKPIKPKVLISRINALLKRSNSVTATKSPDNLSNSKDELVIDREKYIVYKGEKEYILPKKEFELLHLLASKPGRVFTRAEIYSLVWGDDVIVGERTIDVHIRKIREKFGEDVIRTLKGIGYKYNEQL